MAKTQHSKEFKQKLIQECLETGNCSAVAKKHEVKTTTLYSWVRAHKNKELFSKNKSIKQYQKELEEKELEIKILQELLKKTTNVLIKE